MQSRLHPPTLDIRRHFAVNLQKINALTESEFTAILGPIFEHSPWIAERAWASRPFDSASALLARLYAVVEEAGDDLQLALLQAHPNLVGRLARAGALTSESTNEQTSAGLLALDDASMSRFESLNAAYRARFGFPFIICARLNSTDTILTAFEARLPNSPEKERTTAWQEVKKIASLRLDDILGTKS